MSKLDDLYPPWGEAEYRSIFCWETIKGDAELQTEAKVEKSVKNWSDRFVVICRNYLLCYPVAKDGMPKLKDYPKTFIRLDTSSVSKVTVREDLTGLWPKKENVKDCFAVTDDQDKSIAIIVKFGNPAEFNRFYNDLYARIPSLKQDARDLNNWACAITDLTKEMRMPLRIDVHTKPELAEEWVQKMKNYHELVDTWRPKVKLMCRFSELFHEKTRDYMEWFSEAGGGIAREMAKAEDEQMANWKKEFMDIQKVKEKVSKATEVSFFREDFKPVVDFCQGNLTILQQYNIYKRDVLKTTAGDEFAPMEHKLKALIKFLSSFPTADEVDMCENFSKAQIKVANFIWEYEHMPHIQEFHVELRAKSAPEMHPFYTVGGFEIVSQDFGTVLWNKTSWVWFHNDVPFTIRYNFKRADNLFSFHAVKGEPKKGQHVVLPSWKWNGSNGLQPVLSAQAQLDPAIKSQFASVVVTSGSAPLPVMLLTAMIQHVRYVTFTLFGYE